MLTNPKTKWGFSIILAGIVLALALFGGKWGTSYASDNAVNAVPQIDYLFPNQLPAGSPTTTITIVGSGFEGTTQDTVVRFTGNGIDERKFPSTITPTKIWVSIPVNELANPATYILTVIYSRPHTLPTIPPTSYDDVSNPAPFWVYTTRMVFMLPQIRK